MPRIKVEQFSTNILFVSNKQKKLKRKACFLVFLFTQVSSVSWTPGSEDDVLDDELYVTHRLKRHARSDSDIELTDDDDIELTDDDDHVQENTSAKCVSKTKVPRKQVKKQKKKKKKKKKATERAVAAVAVAAAETTSKVLQTMLATIKQSLNETDSGSASPSPSPCSSTSTPPRVPKHKYKKQTKKRQSAASQLKATRQVADNSDMTATHFTTAGGAEYTCPLHLGTGIDAERQFNSCRGQRLSEVPSTVSLGVHVHTIVGDGDCLLRYVAVVHFYF
jgi:hypothetical protein